jgi:hypothetical protein
MVRTTICGKGGWLLSSEAKGLILWDVTVNTTFVHLLNFLAPGSRDMFDDNNKVIDYLYSSLCESEFEWVRTEDLACRIWE